jgi:diguanylate cyclase (GGDEF)-like protein/PAS domain S-box-containing protein
VDSADSDLGELIESTILDMNSFADVLDLGLIVVNRKEEIVIWNSWIAKRSFVEPETVIGKSLNQSFIGKSDQLLKAIDASFQPNQATSAVQTLADISLPLYKDQAALDNGDRIRQSVKVSPIDIKGERLVSIQIDDLGKQVLDEEAVRQQSHELETIAAIAREQQGQLKTILDNSKDSVIILNRLGRISGFYLSAQKMFGYQEMAILGKPLSTLLPSPFAQQYDNLFSDQDKCQDLDSSTEASALRANGELFYTDMSIRAIHDGHDLQFVVTISDITDRKQVQDALYQEKEQAQVTLSSIADGVITTDIIGRINFINPAALKLIGKEREEVINHRIDLVVNIESEHTRLPVFECIEKGVQIDSISGDVLYSKSGHSLVIHQVASPIHNQIGDTIGAVMIFRDVSKSHRLASRLSWQASHDDLTRLINRREFERHLQSAMDSSINENTEHCFCYLDLDKFKVVNDTCGHAAGDELLKQLADIFRDNVRGSDILARLGGDEFAIILTQCKLEPAQRIAEKIRLGIEEFRFGWGETSFQVGVSIGLVMIDSHCPSINEIFNAADSACFAAKQAGRNRVHIYKADDVDIAQRQGEARWMLRIQQALEENRFELNYQPIVPVADGNNAAVHYEILLRMIDEEGNTIPPGAFIPAAERYQMMSKIDYWVIQHVFEWLDQYWDSQSPDIFAINLSGQSMADGDLQQKIKQLLEVSNVRPENISFEITETAAISNLNLATTFISDLKAIGCYFALDDFGSGLSSFAYLKNLPVDYLKIDGAFVKDMNHNAIDRAMVESIHHIGSVMKLKTIAEFVENDEIFQILKEVGIDYAQGFGIARPIPLPRDGSNLLESAIGQN